MVSKVLAKWDFEAQAKTQLSFKTGDVLDIVLQDVNAPGWWVARKDDQEGLIPNNYVTVIEIFEKKKRIMKISQKRVSMRIKRLRESLAMRSESFAHILTDSSNTDKEEDKPSVPAPVPKSDENIISTIARRKKLPENSRSSVISLFDNSQFDSSTEKKEEPIEIISDKENSTSDTKESTENEIKKEDVKHNITEEKKLDDNSLKIDKEVEIESPSIEENFDKPEEKEIEKPSQPENLESTEKNIINVPDDSNVQTEPSKVNNNSESSSNNIPIPRDISGVISSPTTEENNVPSTTSSPSDHKITSSSPSASPTSPRTQDELISEEAGEIPPQPVGNFLWRCIFERCSLL